MKTSIDKNYTHISAVSTVRNALKSFKSIYTESDIVARFVENFNLCYIPDRISDVLEMTVSGYDNVDCVSVMIDAIIFDRCTRFYKIHFHANISNDGELLEIMDDTLLWNVETFAPVN